MRADLRPLLAGCPAADDMVLLVSELAANAIAHSDSGRPGGIFTVRLTHRSARGAQAEVADQGSTWPGDLPVSAQPPHGLTCCRPCPPPAAPAATATAESSGSASHCCGPPLPFAASATAYRAAGRRNR